MIERACVLIAAEFAPFEKYCGKVSVGYRFENATGTTVAIGARWAYKAPDGTRLGFTARLREHPHGWEMWRDTHRHLTVPALRPENVAETFIRLHGRQAEAAFEAIVLEEPWQLRQILQ